MQPINTNRLSIDNSSIAAAILALLTRRDLAASACPSEIARSLVEGKEWRELMPQIRRVLRDLMDSGFVVITRGTNVLSAVEIEGGPIRFRRGPRFELLGTGQPDFR